MQQHLSAIARIQNTQTHKDTNANACVMASCEASKQKSTELTGCASLVVMTTKKCSLALPRQQLGELFGSLSHVLGENSGQTMMIIHLFCWCSMSVTMHRKGLTGIS